MSNIIKDEITLHGHLVGIGKIRKDGSEDFHWLEKPIHNKIVAQGLDYLFQQNGSDNVLSYGSYDYPYVNASTMFATNTANYQYAYNLSTGTYTIGCLEYMAYGNGTGSTEFNMTDLVSRISDYSNSKKTGYPMCGTQEISYGHYKMRISHISAAAQEDTNVTEIGWYGRYGTQEMRNPTNTFVMFSRVALDSPYELSTGEQLITTYELTLNFGNCDAVEDINFFGLTDVDGTTPLKAQVKRIIYKTANDDSYNDMAEYGETKYNFPTITRYGKSVIADMRGFGSSDAGAKIAKPKILPLNYLKSGSYYSGYWTELRPWFWTADKDFPAQYSPDNVNTSTNCDTTSAAPQVIFQPYTAGNFYRDIVIVCGQLFPNNTPLEGYTDIHYINFNGMAYRFGYYADEVNPETGETESVWHPQAIRKYGNKILKLKFRTTLATSDTIGMADVNSQEP